MVSVKAGRNQKVLTMWQPVKMFQNFYWWKIPGFLTAICNTLCYILRKKIHLHYLWSSSVSSRQRRPDPAEKPESFKEQ